MLLVMRQRETSCSQEGWTAPSGRITPHEFGRYACHHCTTRPQDIFDALYVGGDREKKERKRQELIASARAEMSPEKFKGYLAYLEQMNLLVLSMASESTRFYRETHPWMGKSREVSIERALRGLRDRGFVYPRSRGGHGYEWRTVWQRRDRPRALAPLAEAEVTHA